MSLNDFVNNLNGMCDGQDFSRELLKVSFVMSNVVPVNDVL